ncbi:MAG: hypothetical protein JWO92_2037 [Chitinophagaceae bacterium]|nr:hypothetical protein [Chitinophagaceae bacterium]
MLIILYPKQKIVHYVKNNEQKLLIHIPGTIF